MNSSNRTTQGTTTKRFEKWNQRASWCCLYASPVSYILDRYRHSCSLFLESDCIIFLLFLQKWWLLWFAGSHSFFLPSWSINNGQNYSTPGSNRLLFTPKLHSPGGVTRVSLRVHQFSCCVRMMVHWVSCGSCTFKMMSLGSAGSWMVQKRLIRIVQGA